MIDKNKTHVLYYSFIAKNMNAVFVFLWQTFKNRIKTNVNIYVFIYLLPAQH